MLEAVAEFAEVVECDDGLGEIAVEVLLVLVELNHAGVLESFVADAALGGTAHVVQIVEGLE